MPRHRHGISTDRGSACYDRRLMEDTSNQSQFKSWRQALEQGQLTREQMAILEDMVKEGHADSLETAASMLDWQDSIINKPEHMYGF